MNLWYHWIYIKKLFLLIKKIRELTGLGLKEAKDKAECTPSVIMENITENQAFMIESAFKAIGAVVEIS